MNTAETVSYIYILVAILSIAYDWFTKIRPERGKDKKLDKERDKFERDFPDIPIKTIVLLAGLLWPVCLVFLAIGFFNDDDDDGDPQNNVPPTFR